MKKETIVASILGISFGVGIALFFIFNVNQQSNSTKKIIAPIISPVITIPLQNEVSLTITSPAANFLTNTNSITIKGTAVQNATIVVQSPTSEKIMKLDKKDFSFSFPLSLGENTIRVSLYEDKLIDDKTIKVYYFES